MNFTSIEYFLTLEQERSFSKAAEKLNITQQTLSGHIAAVEKEMGCRLFTRRIPLDLTYAGKIFLEHARHIRMEDTELRQSMREIREERRGKLTIGISPTRGRALMPWIITSYQKKWPDITVALREGSNDALEDFVRNGTVDAAIGAFPKPKGENFALTEFYSEEIVLLMSPEIYETAFSEKAPGTRMLEEEKEFSFLARCPFLLNPEGDIAGRFGRNLLRQAGIMPLIRAESSNIETLLELCVRGGGACFTPVNLARAVLTEKTFASLVQVRFAQGAAYEISFISLPQRNQWKMLQDFIKEAKKLYPGQGI
jgi:DNA-binding transcriptional LysR family regulator